MNKLLTISLALAWLAVAPALAQIEPTSPGRQRTANRQALRDARYTDVPYKDSHLDVKRRQLKRGGAETLQKPGREPRFGHDGLPRGNEPRRPGLLRRRRKTELTP